MSTLNYLINKCRIDTSKESPHIIICDRDRDFPGLLAELGFKEGAEIGVALGEFSETLLKGIPGLKLYSIDPWAPYPLLNNFRKQKDQDRAYSETVKRLSPYNCKIIKKYSMDATRDFPDNSLDFVFIDGDHRFEFVTNDIAEWSRKVRLGGVISGHDFGRSKRSHLYHHVEDVVRAWTFSHKINPWFVLKSPGTNIGACFMWVKTEESV